MRQSVLGPKIMPSFNPAEARSKLKKSAPAVRWEDGRMGGWEGGGQDVPHFLFHAEEHLHTKPS